MSRIKNIFVFALCALFVLLLTANSTQAATYYVEETSCSNSCTGSLSQPWCTIQNAASTMVAGYACGNASNGCGNTLNCSNCSSSFQLGVYLEDPSTLSSFEQSIGRKTDIFHWYEELSDDFDNAALSPIAAGGRSILLSWDYWNSSLADPVNQPAYQLKKITAGNYDTAIRRWADEMRNLNYTVIFRPMYEMNGDWVTWDGTVNGNTPADYIPAWRHMHDLFAAEGATNVLWCWCPNVDDTTANANATFANYYPGDSYVDYIGIDGYNWGTSQPSWGSVWQTFEQVFGPSYDVFSTRSAKPLMIPETSCSESGGSKSAWITNAFSILPTRFPRFASLNWFNVNSAGETDWRVNSSTQSLQAFRSAVAASSTTSTSTTSTSTSTRPTTSTTTRPTTTLTSSTTTSSTLSVGCVMAGNYPPCSNVTLSEVVTAIDKWAAGNLPLADVMRLINSWSNPLRYPAN